MMDDDEEDHRSHTSQSPNNQEMMSVIETNISAEKSNVPPHPHRPRVKFAYSFDKDEALPITQTTVIQSEPCFRVIAIEDRVLKHFYQNETKQDEEVPLVEQSTSFESDSLEDEHHPKSTKDQSTTPPIKSILKKPKKTEEEEQQITVIAASKPSRSIKSRSPSPSSSKRHISTTRLDFNEVQHLAEITAKQNLPSPSQYCRSLFDQTINIFNPNYFHEYQSNSSRPSRFHHYVKPYRGDPPTSIGTAKKRSSSLPKPSERASRWHTFSSQHPQPFTKQTYRKQHVSWSPVRVPITASLPKGTETLSIKTDSSPLSRHSYSSQNASSILPVSVHNRSSRFVSSISPNDPYNIPSVLVHPTKALTDEVPSHPDRKDEDDQLKPHRSEQLRKEHDETMKQYDRLLERIRRTDEQLHSLSQSWTKSTHERIPVEINRIANPTLNRVTTHENRSLSPMTIQICLILLIIFNLLIVYFFNEINVWWSENIAPEMVSERHNEPLWNT